MFCKLTKIGYWKIGWPGCWPADLIVVVDLVHILCFEHTVSTSITVFSTNVIVTRRMYDVFIMFNCSKTGSSSVGAAGNGGAGQSTVIHDNTSVVEVKPRLNSLINDTSISLLHTTNHVSQQEKVYLLLLHVCVHSLEIESCISWCYEV